MTARDFLFSIPVQSGLAVHPALCAVATVAFVSGLNKPGRGVSHPLSCSTEVKNEWSHTSASPILFS
jgi:hypothetical protein